MIVEDYMTCSGWSNDLVRSEEEGTDERTFLNTKSFGLGRAKPLGPNGCDTPRSPSMPPNGNQHAFMNPFELDMIIPKKKAGTYQQDLKYHFLYKTSNKD